MHRLVLVDDSMLVRTLFSGFFKESGFDVVGMGKNGDEAIALFGEHQPDLLLLDLTMPGKGGKEALQEIVKEHPSAKIIIFSSVKDPKVEEECLGYGASAFVNKSLNFNEESERNRLLETVRKVLES